MGILNKVCWLHSSFCLREWSNHALGARRHKWQMLKLRDCTYLLTVTGLFEFLLFLPLKWFPLEGRALGAPSLSAVAARDKQPIITFRLPKPNQSCWLAAVYPQCFPNFKPSIFNVSTFSWLILISSFILISIHMCRSALLSWRRTENCTLLLTSFKLKTENKVNMVTWINSEDYYLQSLLIKILILIK